MVWHTPDRCNMCKTKQQCTALLEPIVCKSCGFSGGEASWLALVRACELPSWLHSASCDWYFYDALDSHMKSRGWLTKSRSNFNLWMFWIHILFSKSKNPKNAETFWNTSRISLMHIFKVNCLVIMMPSIIFASFVDYLSALTMLRIIVVCIFALSSTHTYVKVLVWFKWFSQFKG